MNEKPLPKGIALASLNGITPVFIYAKGKIATFDLPEGQVKKVAAKLKIPKAVTSGMKKTAFYMVDPQPYDLSLGWCQLLAVPNTKKSQPTLNADLWQV